MNEIEDMTRFELIEPCLYFLMDGDEVVYVGQTRSFHLRMYQHKNGEASTPAKVFNRVKYEVMDRNELDKAEAWHMLKHMPKYNRQLRLKGQLNMLRKLAEQFNDVAEPINIEDLRERHANSIRNTATGRALGAALDELERLREQRKRDPG